MANGYLGWRVLNWLVDQPDVSIAGIVIHPTNRGRYQDEMLLLVQSNNTPIFYGNTINENSVIEQIRQLNVDIGVSIMFGYILRSAFLKLFKYGVINLHPSFLPYNRGAYPNVWSIVERTPAGVTLHYIDEGIDTGDIIAQQIVEVEPIDTGASLYSKLEEAAFDLFKIQWPNIAQNKINRIPQTQAGTSHRVRDVDTIDHIDLDQQYVARDLLNILRARTFPPYKGAYFVEAGRKVYVRVQLEYGDESE